MRSLWLVPAFVAALLSVGLSRPAHAGEAEEQALRDLVTRLTAQVEMLAAKVERLDKRVAELQTRLAMAGATAPAASEPRATPVESGGQPSGPALAERPAAAPTSAEGKAAEQQARALAARLPKSGRWNHSHRIASEYFEAIDRTFVRLAPVKLAVISDPSIDLAMGALLTYDGRAPKGLPDSAQLDFVSHHDSWTADASYRVVFYVDNVAQDLGKATFKEEKTLGGVRTVTFTVKVPLTKLLDILLGEEVLGILGGVEFVVRADILEALRDFVLRCVPAATGSAPAAPAAAR